MLEQLQVVLPGRFRAHGVGNELIAGEVVGAVDIFTPTAPDFVQISLPLLFKPLQVLAPPHQMFSTPVVAVVAPLAAFAKMVMADGACASRLVAALVHGLVLVARTAGSEAGIIPDNLGDLLAKDVVVGDGAEYLDVEGVGREEDARQTQRDRRV